MSLLGRDGSEGIKIALTPKLLVRLARDLLVARAHQQVRQTDGPGDGGRDVYSLTEAGEKHLAQCKHHDDPSHACSSDEVSELPMAMVKFGVQHGLFLTDARISPQAKREYLNDYPHLKLEFLDRDELVSEVLARSALRALWFDGGRLGAVNASVTFPLIVRRHEGDKPLLPLRHAAVRESLLEIARDEAARRGLALEVREVWSTREPFEPYRPPRQLTMEEGARSDLRVTEIALHGALALHELAPLSECLAEKIASATSAKFGATSVAVGRAFVTPLDGDQAGLRTLTDAPRSAAVGVDGVSLDEGVWFLPTDASKWDPTCDARVTESEWVRLYHPELDVALSYEIVTPMTPMDAVVRQIASTGWMRSIFALLPAWQEWPYEDLEEPDDRADWTYEPGRVLCGWFHPFAGGGLVRIPSDTGDEPPLIEPIDERAADAHLLAIREQVERFVPGALVAPERARHMLALLTEDPLAGDRPTIFRTADVLAAFSALPSPIDPAARRAKVTIGWSAGPGAEEPIVRAGLAWQVQVAFHPCIGRTDSSSSPCDSTGYRMALVPQFGSMS